MNILVGLIVVAAISPSIICDTNYRLSTKVIPSEYEITITPYFDTGDDLAFTFDGQVKIKVNTSNSGINQIKLHSDDLVFGQENVTVKEGDKVLQLNKVNPIEFDKNYTFVYINLETHLAINTEHEINIVYRGRIRDDLTGLFRSSYEENGKKKWFATTHMEPYHTRKVFPCFDEPEFKAQFSLIIDRPEEFSSSLTNTKLQDIIVLNNGYVRERFYPTPIMSSYLVAFLVSELENGGYIQNGERQFGIWARPQATNQSEFAFDFGKRVVQALSDYIGIDYYSIDSNLNLNHVAVPDFRGAMENWGLINYGETYVLYDGQECSPTAKTAVASTIAHETAHQWFGNLATCHWWTDIWLNEGFATYFEDFITSVIDPELGAEDLLVTGSSYTAAMADERPNASPLTHLDINSPSEISGSFGSISYKKGGTMIRMIHHLIGDEAFRRGLQEYFTSRRLGIVTPEMLYMALDAGVSYTNSLASYPGYTVATVMAPWVSQAGHPVLHVTLNETSNEITLRQNRFYWKNVNESNELYTIPVSFATKSNPNFDATKPAFIMGERTHTFGNISEDDWIIFNIQDTGYYRVNYDETLLKRIRDALNGEDRTKIHHLNRAKIVNDLFELAYADYISFAKVFDVLDFLNYETEYSVWLTAVAQLKSLLKNIMGIDNGESVQKFILEKMKYMIDVLGFDEKEGDSFITLKLRSLIAGVACELGHKNCVVDAVEKFRQFRNNNFTVPPSLRPTVYCLGLRYGTVDDFDAMLERMGTTNHLCEANVIRTAMACSPHKDNIKSYMESWVSDGSSYRTQDILTDMSGVLAHSDNFGTAFAFLRQYYAAIRNNVRSMEGVVALFANAAVYANTLDEFQEWLGSCAACRSEELATSKTVLEEKEIETRWTRLHVSEIVAALANRNAAMVTLPSMTFTIILSVVTSAVTVMF